MIDLACMPLESRLIQHLLSSPIEDGGQFDMFVVLSRYMTETNKESR